MYYTPPDDNCGLLNLGGHDNCMSHMRHAIVTMTLSLVIFFWRSILGFGRFGWLAFRFGRSGLAVAGGRGLGLAAGGIFFGAGLVIITAIIGDVKTAAFEDQTRAAADTPFHLALAPLLHPAQFLGTGF